jgi:hypothetical protein
MPILQVIPIAKKLRIAQARLIATKKKLILLAHSFGSTKSGMEQHKKKICNLPGLPKRLLSTVLCSPVRYLSGVSI